MAVMRFLITAIPMFGQYLFRYGKDGMEDETSDT